MTDDQKRAGYSLLRNGKWAVPPEKRPGNWRDLDIEEMNPEEIESPAPESQPKADVEPPRASPSPEPTPASECPAPPKQFEQIFGPILHGIHAGLKARRELIELTHYCMMLEIFLQESDLRRVHAGERRQEPETQTDGVAANKETESL